MRRQLLVSGLAFVTCFSIWLNWTASVRFGFIDHALSNSPEVLRHPAQDKAVESTNEQEGVRMNSEVVDPIRTETHEKDQFEKPGILGDENDRTKVCCESGWNHTVCCLVVPNEHLFRLDLCRHVRSSRDAECSNVTRRDDYPDDDAPIIKDKTRRGLQRSSHALVLHENDDPNSAGTFYTHLRPDRSGEVWRDQIQALFFAFRHRHISYAGVCPLQHVGRPLRPVDTDLLADFGLSAAIRVTCPEGIRRNTRIYPYFQRKHSLPVKLGLTSTTIYTNGFEDWDMDFKAHIETIRGSSTSGPGPNYTIAVHVRRGDVGACTSDGYSNRYLPNSYYLSVIDEYSERYRNSSPSRPLKVVIYSQSRSEESFDAFLDRGYEVRLDASIGDTWKGLAGSDVLIMSRSSFSIVPAFLQRPTSIAVVPSLLYNMGSKLDWWHHVDIDGPIWTKTIEEMKARCHTNHSFVQRS